MTREEAKESLEVNLTYFCDEPDLESNAEEVINKIFDDFESRTCKSCKHLESSEYDNECSILKMVCYEEDRNALATTYDYEYYGAGLNILKPSEFFCALYCKEEG